jgi:hypothetical protein
MPANSTRRNKRIWAAVLDVVAGHACGSRTVRRSSIPFSESFHGPPVGFYKRGCQEKTLFLFREDGIFF